MVFTSEKPTNSKRCLSHESCVEIGEISRILEPIKNSRTTWSTGRDSGTRPKKTKRIATLNRGNDLSIIM